PTQIPSPPSRAARESSTGRAAAARAETGTARAAAEGSDGEAGPRRATLHLHRAEVVHDGRADQVNDAAPAPAAAAVSKVGDNATGPFVNAGGTVATVGLDRPLGVHRQGAPGQEHDNTATAAAAPSGIVSGRRSGGGSVRTVGRDEAGAADREVASRING